MKFQYDILVSMENGRVQLNSEDFQLKKISESCMEGEFGELKVRLEQDACNRLSLSLENHTDMACDSLQWSFLYRDTKKDLSLCRVHCFGKSVDTSGMPRLCDVKKTQPDSAISGLFAGAREACLFLGTQLPQSNLQLYQAELIDHSTVKFTGTTKFPVGMRKRESLTTEVTYVLQGMTPLEAMTKYSEHIPDLPQEKYPAPRVGWNSWDYYFSSISMEDIRENIDFISEHPELRNVLKCVVVDDGWETCVGDWFANHRFPEGLEKLASDIRERGLIPGIWTNGAQVQMLSYPGLRCGEMLIKQPSGAPLMVDGMFVLDPTHPKTETFLFELYSRLYQCGFRIFKVDFVSTILEAEQFYDPDCGPYDAIRRLFEIVRRAVGEDSHIVGCSYPAECGAGYVDSCRIGVDIHNQWTHVRWVLEYMQNHFWCNGKLYRIDPDMMIVRGKDTSLEEETNVYNPFTFNPYEEGNISKRWRRGPVFDYYEAETWANLVVFSGGDLMLGDRLSMLNEKGMELLLAHLTPHVHAAKPLDLGDGEVAGLWYDDSGEEESLLIINHAEEEKEMCFRFADYGIEPPSKVTDDKGGCYKHGVYFVTLHRHESAILKWKK